MKAAAWTLLVCVTAAGALHGQEFDKAAERSLVERIHQRIVEKSSEAAKGEMKSYTRQIPKTVVTFSMVPITGGEYTMGTPASEPGHRPDEAPQHKVKVSPFWMGKLEVTWDEYRLFMLRISGRRKDGDPLVDAVSSPTPPYVEMSFGMGINGYPAIAMTQHAASKYAEWLSAKTGEFYRLPTEAEWEYACRAGTSTAYFFGESPEKLGEYAWYEANSDYQYQQVGKKKPNPWGLYDILGNVGEWTLDAYRPHYPEAKGVAVNPWVKATTLYPRVIRGGSWEDQPERVRCGARLPSDPSWKSEDPQLPQSIWYYTDTLGLGFRLVRPQKIPSAAEMYEYWNSASGMDQ